MYAVSRVAVARPERLLEVPHLEGMKYTDHDLYSMGLDEKTKLPLTAKDARDDIVRAGNGGFLGLAANH